MYFEVESDRDVTVNAIGLLEAGVPVRIDDNTRTLFTREHGVDITQANFPTFVQVTAVVEEDN
jgi:hypothetical protein